MHQDFFMLQAMTAFIKSFADASRDQGKKKEWHFFLVVDLQETSYNVGATMVVKLKTLDLWKKK